MTCAESIRKTNARLTPSIRIASSEWARAIEVLRLVPAVVARRPREAERLQGRANFGASTLGGGIQIYVPNPEDAELVAEFDFTR